MASPLLACRICTKKPTFTDVSHLLTHVGSKGHLAQLHKLQVKSHQELAAGLQLAEYNQWFHEHDLAQLLSERLHQKEKKQTARGVKKEEAIKAEPDTAQQKPVRGRGRPRKVQTPADDVQPSAYNGNTASYPLTPLRDSSSLQYTPRYAASNQLDIDPSLIGSPEKPNANIKLKGKVWPGMALFDAASPDEARRRNQKKDASVVKRMARLSSLVQPNEVTFSSEWSPLKSRHIDDLEDASSLIEGESPLMIKPKPKPKRKVLGEITGNVRRQSKRKAKASPSPKQTRRRRVKKQEPALPELADNIYTGPYSSLYAPGEQELGDDDDDGIDMDQNALLPVKQGVGARFAEFTIFEDSPAAPQKPATQHLSLPHSYVAPVPRLSFQTPSWLQPQNQNPLYMETGHSSYKIGGGDDPYKAGGAVNHLQRIENGQIEAHVQKNNRGRLNPLSWPSPKINETTNHSPESSFGPFSGYVTASGLSDPFAFTKNPLADALAHFNGGGNTHGLSNHGVLRA